mmetsp:Transcript_44997/g.104096  ORF Transcript_44997/g.104096 Transcript_44997/m.104096 type:complete len:332 (-) Transcript_44997:48-1043(-)
MPMVTALSRMRHPIMLSNLELFRMSLADIWQSGFLFLAELSRERLAVCSPRESRRMPVVVFPRRKRLGYSTSEPSSSEAWERNVLTRCGTSTCRARCRSEPAAASALHSTSGGSVGGTGTSHGIWGGNSTVTVPGSSSFSASSLRARPRLLCECSAVPFPHTSTHSMSRASLVSKGPFSSKISELFLTKAFPFGRVIGAPGGPCRPGTSGGKGPQGGTLLACMRNSCLMSCIKCRCWLRISSAHTDCTCALTVRISRSRLSSTILKSRLDAGTEEAGLHGAPVLAASVLEIEHGERLGVLNGTMWPDFPIMYSSFLDMPIRGRARAQWLSH